MESMAETLWKGIVGGESGHLPSKYIPVATLRFTLFLYHFWYVKFCKPKLALRMVAKAGKIEIRALLMVILKFTIYYIFIYILYI